MRTITFEISDMLYEELAKLCERETDTVDKMAHDVLFDTMFEHEVADAWNRLHELEMYFDNVPVLAEAIDNFSNVLIICDDVEGFTRESSFELLQKGICLLENYKKHNITENLNYVVNYLNSIYDEHKAAMFAEVKRLAKEAEEA